jgi:hypothetical protein
VRAAKDLAGFFHAVSDHPASAMRAFWSESLYRAFEAVEYMGLVFENHLERLS